MHTAILNQIRSIGYAVSEHHSPSSLLGSVGPAVEMHAVLLADPAQQHIDMGTQGHCY